jgi:hypothetical protein
MKKASIKTIIVIVILLVIVSIFLKKQDTEKKGSSSTISVSNSEMLTESIEGYNSIQVYQKEKMIVINAKSSADFFDDTQFTVEVQDTIQPSDIVIEWTTVGGKSEKSESNDRIIAEIIIKENNKLIFDKKINFMRKGIDAIEDILKEKSK